MYCLDNCLELKLCHSTQLAGVESPGESTALTKAVTQLDQALASTHASLDNCFVFTLENRNRLMHRIGEVRELSNQVGCGYLQELCSLAEIITLILFRSHRYRDHQGLEQIERAVQQMHICCTDHIDSQSQNNRDEGHRMPETVECLWRWVDANTPAGIDSIEIEKPSRISR
jgi:hypothetical protein